MTKEQREKLLYQPKNGYDRLTKDEEAELNAYCEAYKAFLDRSKTERECVFTAIREAEARGFVEYKPGMQAHGINLLGSGLDSYSVAARLSAALETAS